MEKLPETKAQGKVTKPGAPPVRPGTVLLADCSGSMTTIDNPPAVGLGARRIERLAEILGYLLSRVRLQGLVCFADLPEEILLEGHVAIPEPAGGTALHLALRHVLEMRPRPVRVIVICDGEPDDAGQALLAARLLRPAPIDAYFCGNDRDVFAADFMRKLAEAGGPGGRWGKFDLSQTQAIAEQLRLRIAGPRG